MIINEVRGLCEAPDFFTVYMDPPDMFKLVHYEARMDWQAGSWHPTGMLSCFQIN